MDEETLKVIEALLEGVTTPKSSGWPGHEQVNAETEFLIAARTEIPALIAEVRLLQKILGDKMQEDEKLNEGFRRGVLAALNAFESGVEGYFSKAYVPNVDARLTKVIVEYLVRAGVAEVRTLLEGR